MRSVGEKFTFSSALDRADGKNNNIQIENVGDIFARFP